MTVDAPEAVVEPVDGGAPDDGWSGDAWFLRSYAVDDIRIAKTTDGRTVEAYAAVFDTPAEVRDRDGEYLEVIGPKAFNRATSRPPFKPMVIYNHGLRPFGRPASGQATVPLGEALEIRPDARGVFTRSRYHSGAFADEVLQAVIDGVITGQSFRGAFTRSRPGLRPGRTFRRADDGSLTTVVREEVYPLVEFGPTPTPVYTDAAIVGVRSESLERLRALISTPADGEAVDDLDLLVGAALGEEADGAAAPSRSHVIAYQRARALARRRGVL